MKRKTILTLSLMMIFLANSIISGSAAAEPFAVGDSFTFTVTDATAKTVVNGTEYLVNSKVDFSNSMAFLVTSKNSTSVDLQYTENDVNKTAYADIDGFLALYFTILFAAGLSLAFASPELASFSAPDNNTSTSSSEPIDVPMFASGNVDLYNLYVPNSTETSSTTPTSSASSDYSYSTGIIDSNAKVTDTQFTLSYDFSITKTKATEDFEYSIDSAFKAVVDMERHILTELSFKLNTNLILGNATKSTFSSFRVVEGNGGGLPGFELIPFFSVFSIASMVILIKKRKTQ